MVLVVIFYDDGRLGNPSVVTVVGWDMLHTHHTHTPTCLPTYMIGFCHGRIVQFMEWMPTRQGHSTGLTAATALKLPHALSRLRFPHAGACLLCHHLPLLLLTALLSTEKERNYRKRKAQEEGGEKKRKEGENEEKHTQEGKGLGGWCGSPKNRNQGVSSSGSGAVGWTGGGEMASLFLPCITLSVFPYPHYNVHAHTSFSSLHLSPL